MKKSLFSLATAAMLAAFASCTQDEAMDMTYVNGPVNSTLTVELPTEGLKTRALPETMPADHDLRCILEVRQGGSAINRDIQTVSADAGAENLTFNLYLEEGDYDFVLWADYVDPNSEADKYYDTDDLNAVTVINPSSLFNTDACDAFFGTTSFTKTGTEAESHSVTLTRALAKVIVSNTDASALYKASTVDVSLQLPNTFNVTDKSATGSIDATLTDATLLGDGITESELFSFYTFVNGDAQGELGQILVTFDNNPAVAIPAGVPVQRNYRTNATGTFLIPDEPVTGDVTVTVDINGDWGGDNSENVTPEEPVFAPKVGDYYYSDGSWSSTLNEEKICIGIVFSTDPSKFADNIEKYAGSGLTGEIKGYVVALENVRAGKGTLFPAEAAEAAATVNLSDLSGYVNTQALLANDLCTTYADQLQLLAELQSYSDKYAAPDETSGWYMPSQTQMVEVAGLYTGYEGGGFTVTANDAFKAAVDALNADPDYEGNDNYEGINMSEGALNMATSTITAGATQAVQAGSAEADTPPYWNIRLLKGFSIAGFSGNLRPILTF